MHRTLFDCNRNYLFSCLWFFSSHLRFIWCVPFFTFFILNSCTRASHFHLSFLLFFMFFWLVGRLTAWLAGALLPHADFDHYLNFLYNLLCHASKTRERQREREIKSKIQNRMEFHASLTWNIWKLWNVSYATMHWHKHTHSSCAARCMKVHKIIWSHTSYYAYFGKSGKCIAAAAAAVFSLDPPPLSTHFSALYKNEDFHHWNSFILHTFYIILWQERQSKKWYIQRNAWHMFICCYGRATFS